MQFLLTAYLCKHVIEHPTVLYNQSIFERHMPCPCKFWLHLLDFVECELIAVCGLGINQFYNSHDLHVQLVLGGCFGLGGVVECSCSLCVVTAFL